MSLTGVTKTYGRGEGAVRALDDISLVFERGTFTAIMGPSGSGKTTLLQSAAGLDRPDQGTVRIGGTELTRMPERRLARLRRQSVGFVFQSFNLLPSLTAAQNTILPLRLAGEHPRRRAAREALGRVGLADRAGTVPRSCPAASSSGWRSPARSSPSPSVIFADEPTGALDTRSAREVLAILRGMTDDDGRTLVMVTHDPVSAAVADRVVFLADGRVVDELAGAPARGGRRPDDGSRGVVAPLETSHQKWRPRMTAMLRPRTLAQRCCATDPASFPVRPRTSPLQARHLEETH